MRNLPSGALKEFMCTENHDCDWDTSGNYCCGFIEMWYPADVNDGGEYGFITRCGDTTRAVSSWSPIRVGNREAYIQARCIDNTARSQIKPFEDEYKRQVGNSSDSTPGVAANVNVTTTDKEFT